MFGEYSIKKDGIERFDQSFLVFMVRDFAILLVVVVIIELGVKFSLVYYNYQTTGQIETQRTAASLAENVKSIMLNSGGPVAARTIYPIIKKNHQDLGYEIAIEPSGMTVSSIEEIFGFSPKGIAASWSEGPNHMTTVDLQADEFCLSCHSAAKMGDVLGRVTVRRYWDTDLTTWIEAVQVTGVFSLGKTLVHTVLLYFLLLSRMEPLLALRGAVSRLATAGSDLSYRAPIKSDDEFGELASNLNKFLNRLTTIIEDLDRVLTKVDDANNDLKDAQRDMNAIVSKVQTGTDTMRAAFLENRMEIPQLGDDWVDSVRTVFAALRAGVDPNTSPNLVPRLNELESRLKGLIDQSKAANDTALGTEKSLNVLSTDMAGFRPAMAEMAVLEEKMHAIAEEGQILVHRLLKDNET